MVNILVVEDDKPSGLILKKLLLKSGYNVAEIVETGEDAFKAIHENRPNLVLMDISLPGELDGIQTAEKIFNTYNIPFIYITAGTDGPTFERAKRSMPMNYIVKPFNAQSLTSTIEMALFKFEMENRLRESEENRKIIIDAIPDRFFEIKSDGSPLTEKDAAVIKEFWSTDTRKQAIEYIARAIETGQVQIFEHRKPVGDHWIFLESRIIKTSSPVLLVMVRDISDRKMHELTMTDQMSMLEDTIRKRTGELQNANTTLLEEIDKRNTVEQKNSILIDLVEESPRSILLIDSHGVVNYVNKAFTILSGYSKNELTGLNVTQAPNPVLPEPDFLKHLKDKESWKGEFYNMSKDGKLYYLDGIINKMRNEDGVVEYYVVNADNITQQKQDELELEKMKKTLRGSSAESIDKDMDWQTWKEKMLSRNVSRTDKSIFHNINNSFTQGAGFGTLITFMEMISKTSKPKDDNKLLVDQSLFIEAMKNVKIAQDCFKIFAGIDWIISNNIELEEKSMRELYTILKGIISKSRQLIEINENRVILNEYSRSMKDIKVQINTQYFSEAVSELLLNALKFSKPATNIYILIYVHNNTLRISIVNDPIKTGDGILGIPPEYEKIIFEPFYRISRMVYEKYNSLDFGIGLTFVEKIITRHGGEIFAENVLDHSDIKKDPLVKVNIMISLPITKGKGA
ncbi:MAG TPA: PAS domain S-box protein [Spirochaetota bacterium]|nr:PAS domain S-box protein [Spirochaetota bacterium]